LYQVQQIKSPRRARAYLEQITDNHNNHILYRKIQKEKTDTRTTCAWQDISWAPDDTDLHSKN